MMVSRTTLDDTTVFVLACAVLALGHLTQSARAQNQDAERGPDLPEAPAVSAVPFPLRYVEASTGLSTPAWDGGRSVIEFADLNLDGHLDIVTVGDHGSPFINTNMHGITVWFGDGAGQWSVFQNGNFGYGGIAVGDANNDGLPDVGYGIHHNYSSSDFGDQLMEVALGDGTGRNWTPWDDGLAEHGQTWGMFGCAFADIDADGWLDLASASFGCCNGFQVYRNNHDGTWEWTFASSGGNSTMDIASGDINNDGYPDFATAISNGTIWMNDQNGSFVLRDENLPPGGTLGRRGPDLGDITSNGFDDLSFVNANGGVEVWLWAPDTARWVKSSVGLPATGDFEVTQLADMNSDGRMDVVAFGNKRLVIWAGDGQGGPWRPVGTFTVPKPGGFAAIAIDDADHNGFPDIALVSDQGGIFNSKNKLQFFRQTTAPTIDSIRIQSPPRYRTIRLGSVVLVRWISSIRHLTNGTVTMEISLDGPGGPWAVLGENLPNNGRYQFNMPAGGAASDVYLRATVSEPGQRSVTHTHGPFLAIPR